jgi:hypothetical protein
MEPLSKQPRPYVRATLVGLVAGALLVGALAYQKLFSHHSQPESVSSDDIVDGHGQRYPKSAYEAGRKQAERDLQQGILATESYGLPGPWSAEFWSLLAERYHIEQKSIAGCVVTPNESGHAKGYNDVMHSEIEKRFGQDLFRQVASEAIQKHDAKSVP